MSLKYLHVHHQILWKCIISEWRITHHAVFGDKCGVLFSCFVLVNQSISKVFFNYFFVKVISDYQTLFKHIIFFSYVLNFANEKRQTFLWPMGEGNILNAPGGNYPQRNIPCSMEAKFIFVNHYLRKGSHLNGCGFESIDYTFAILTGWSPATP